MPTATTPNIAPLDAGDGVTPAAQTLADAFFDDPMTVYLIPDERRRKRALPHYFASVLRLSRASGVIETATRDGRVEAAIVSMPPGTYPLPLLPQFREFRTLLACGFTAAVRNFRDLPPIENAHPHEPFWYVMYLGVDPAAQRSGLGGALLARTLARADAQSVPAYLVTMKRDNLAYYARFGFEVRDQLRMGKRGPDTWTLLRPAPAAVAAT